MKKEITQLGRNIIGRFLGVHRISISSKHLALSCFIFFQMLVVLVSQSTNLLAQETSIWEANFNSSDELPSAWRNESGLPNVWVVNSVYEGSTNTPLQPKTITGGPAGRYLHITSQNAKSKNANYDPSTECFSEVTTPSISTLGYTNVQFSFYTICGGLEKNDFGQLLVSVNNGEFELLEPSFFGVENWKQFTYPGVVGKFDNALIRFKFVWKNNGDNSGGNISFGIDELSLKGTAITKGVIINEAIPKAVCGGGNFRLNYRGFGEFTLNNEFIVEMSDDKGNFSDTPTTIGSLSSQLNTGIIFCNIPKEIIKGTFLLRIKSTKPEYLSINTIKLILSPPAIPGKAVAADDTLCFGGNTVIDLQGYEGTITWEISYDGINFVPIPGTDLPNFSTELIKQTTYYRARVTGGSCPPAYSNIVMLKVAPPITAGTAVAVPYEFCVPSSTKLTLTNYSPNAKIQWQESFDELEYFDIAGANENEFTTPLITNTVYYRAAVSSPFCATFEKSNTVKVTYGMEVFCKADPQRALPGESVIIYVIASAIAETPGKITFDPGDGSNPTVFDNRKSPVIIEYKYDNPISATYVVTVESPSGCTGRCEGVISVNDHAIILTTLPRPFLCVGDSGEIAFETKGTFGKGNDFIAELSDERGDFLAATAIGQQSLEGVVAFKIPMNAAGGGGYKIRLRSTNPIAYSDEVTSITVTPAPAQGVITAPSLICSADTVTLNIDGQEPGAELLWEVSYDGVKFEPIEDGFFTQQKFFLKEKAFFRVKLTPIGPGGACLPGYSDTVLVNVGMSVKCSYKPDPAENGKPVVFSVELTNDPGPFTFDWQFGDNKSEFFDNVSTLPHVVTHTYEKPGKYEYSVKVKGKYCIGSCQATINVAEGSFEVSISSISPNLDQACGGDVWEVSVSGNRKPDTNNIYSVELSDENGSFSTPIRLGTINSSESSAKIAATIPENIIQGSAYKVRATASMPKAISAVYDKTYQLNPKPAKPLISVNGKTLEIKSPGVGTYTWYVEGSANSLGTGTTFTPSGNAKYKVIYSDRNGCRSESEFINYTSIDKFQREQSLKVYPNPFRDNFEVKALVNGPTADLVLYNMMGQKIASKRIDSKSGIINETFDVGTESAGVYFFKIISGGKEQMLKVIKQ